MVEKRTLGIILTIVTALFCGCPGMFICLLGGLSAAGLGTYTTDVLGTTGVGQPADRLRIRHAVCWGWSWWPSRS